MSAFAQRASGIVVPAATLDKQQKTVTHQQFAKFRQGMKHAREHGMVALFCCGTCKQQIKLFQAARLITGLDVPDDGKAPGGRFSLSCDCTTWSVR